MNVLNFEVLLINCSFLITISTSICLKLLSNNKTVTENMKLILGGLLRFIYALNVTVLDLFRNQIYYKLFKHSFNNNQTNIKANSYRFYTVCSINNAVGLV